MALGRVSAFCGETRSTEYKGFGSGSRPRVQTRPVPPIAHPWRFSKPAAWLVLFEWVRWTTRIVNRNFPSSISLRVWKHQCNPRLLYWVSILGVGKSQTRQNMPSESWRVSQPTLDWLRHCSARTWLLEVQDQRSLYSFEPSFWGWRRSSYWWLRARCSVDCGSKSPCLVDRFLVSSLDGLFVHRSKLFFMALLALRGYSIFWIAGGSVKRNMEASALQPSITFRQHT